MTAPDIESAILWHLHARPVYGQPRELTMEVPPHYVVRSNPPSVLARLVAERSAEGVEVEVYVRKARTPR